MGSLYNAEPWAVGPTTYIDEVGYEEIEYAEEQPMDDDCGCGCGGGCGGHLHWAWKLAIGVALALVVYALWYFFSSRNKG